MKIQTEEKEGVLVIYPMEKSLDSTISIEFKESMKKLIQEGNKRLVIDLRHVEFIDSSGLGAIVLGHKEIRKIGELKLVTSNPQLKNMFDLVRLEQLINIYKYQQDALDSFN